MNHWTRRIERAAELEQRYPAVAEILRFYRDLAVFQSNPHLGPDFDQHLPDLLELVCRNGTAVRAEHADSLNAFCLRVLEQPYFERQALQSGVDTKTVQSTCPFCFEKPVVAVLRPERTLLCGRCFTEWQFRRMLCPGCGEEDKDKLPVFTSPEFPQVRIEACETCRHYIKAVDLTRDGRAIPEVDEIAALPLDLWAKEQNYQKLTPNLFW